MLIHPLTQSVWIKTIGVAIVLLLSVTVWAFLVLYGGMPFTAAIADSLFYIGLLGVSGYFYWYVMGFMKMIQAQIVIALTVQIVCLAATFMFLSIAELENTDMFINTIPLRLVIGISTWIILQQWYHKKQMVAKLANENITQQKKDEFINASITKKTVSTVDVLDRISVRDNSQIHIIKIEELVYIQAYGDYVILYTDSGKYIKELTMKYLEANLPTSFLRVHRSYIVNTDYIIRVELFGKETYQVRLKNGVCLRVSNTGYKALKDKLIL